MKTSLADWRPHHDARTLNGVFLTFQARAGNLPRQSAGALYRPSLLSPVCAG